MLTLLLWLYLLHIDKILDMKVRYIAEIHVSLYSLFEANCEQIRNKNIAKKPFIS